ncbi:MAG: PRTRC system protein D [Burkholderia contaminans]|uniref:Plasmid segregation protein ParM n=2 Tax=Pseudomonadota TaxID=1224 RepID=A0A228HNZ1_9BURK|nr:MULTISPECIES: PRTRC system protein D [Burkholderia cepacia complex]KVR79855.1 plasmid segregation protein ParM [Burkholderia vietnamiensis]KVS01741.1 plasmid segregation protein ParM [Burkholderia vietnamiensis]MBR8009217.1 PRTRC system protein D [Burkholderia vietnamiensis]MBR8152600.1 PRTRC system protein D [Burkholderia vietnamiensis]MBR8164616.1 PRTRC system protein D [Burkholderia vietnamiensis]
MKTAVFAIDVGYGNTKYAHRAASGTIATGMFPSLTPLAASRTLSGYGESVLTARKVSTIVIDQVEYEVGPDVPLTAAYGNTGRALADDYVLSDNYAALLFGAIHFSGVTHIERLVLGLPVHNMKKYSADLKERFAGELDFGAGRVTVDKVVVIPQPLGSLVLASSNRQHEFGRDVAHLVVDVGYFTTDWVYANGFTMDDNRSGGMPGGASQIYQRIASLVARDQGDEVEDIERIDKALREQTPFFFYGTNIDLAPYLEQAQPLISGVVKEMQNNVGRLPNVRSIILSGGGAALYAAVIRRAFPRVLIEVIDAPCLANVRGFLMVGEAGLARERR